MYKKLLILLLATSFSRTIFVINASERQHINQQEIVYHEPMGKCDPAMIAARGLSLVGEGFWTFCKMVQELCEEEEEEEEMDTWMNLQLPLPYPADQPEPVLESLENLPSLFQPLHFKRRPELRLRKIPELVPKKDEKKYNRPARFPNEGEPEWPIGKWPK